MWYPLNTLFYASQCVKTSFHSSNNWFDMLKNYYRFVFFFRLGSLTWQHDIVINSLVGLHACWFGKNQRTIKSTIHQIKEIIAHFGIAKRRYTFLIIQSLYVELSNYRFCCTLLRCSFLWNGDKQYQLTYFDLVMSLQWKEVCLRHNISFCRNTILYVFGWCILQVRKISNTCKKPYAMKVL